MKCSTLMAIVLVAQAVLIMGVFAVVSIENTSAAVADEKDTVEPINLQGNLPCCKKCTGSPSSGRKCQDEGDFISICRDSNCHDCRIVRSYPKQVYKCNDEFLGTCDSKCKKN